MVQLLEPVKVALLVGDVLDSLQVPWLVGGSVASSLHGIPRSTHDVDLVADLREFHVLSLANSLSDRFLADTDALLDAVSRRSCCNLIHLETMTKVDIFVMRQDALAHREMARRQFFVLENGARMPLASAEDIVLQKLIWFHKGGRVSERQWRDVLGVLQVSGSELDSVYLREMAQGEGLLDLLDEALAG